MIVVTESLAESELSEALENIVELVMLQLIICWNLKRSSKVIEV